MKISAAVVLNKNFDRSVAKYATELELQERHDWHIGMNLIFVKAIDGYYCVLFLRPCRPKSPDCQLICTAQYSSPFLIIVLIASYSIYFNLYTGKIWGDLKMWKGANFISYYKSWFLTAISLQGSIVVLTYSVFNISNWYEVILDNFFQFR